MPKSNRVFQNAKRLHCFCSITCSCFSFIQLEVNVDMTSFSRMKFSMQWSISVFITSCPQNTVYIFSLNVKSMFIHNFDILTVTSLPQRNTKAINWSSLWCQWSNVVFVNSRRAAPSPATPSRNPSPGLVLWQAWVHVEVAVLHTATSRLSCKQLGLFRRRLSLNKAAYKSSRSLTLREKKDVATCFRLSQSQNDFHDFEFKRRCSRHSEE